MGAVSNVAQTVISNGLNNKGTSSSDVVKSAALGAGLGAFGGAFKAPSGLVNPITHYGGDIPIIQRSKILVNLDIQENIKKSAVNAFSTSLTGKAVTSGFASNGGIDYLYGKIRKGINDIKARIAIFRVNNDF